MQSNDIDALEAVCGVIKQESDDGTSNEANTPIKLNQTSTFGGMVDETVSVAAAE